MIPSRRLSLLCLCLHAFTVACQGAQDDFSRSDAMSDLSSDKIAPGGVEWGDPMPEEGPSIPGGPGDWASGYDCTVYVGLQSVEQSQEKAMERARDYCDDATDERSRYVARGANVRTVVDAGRPVGAGAECGDEVAGEGTSSLSVGVAVMKMRGDCPSIDELELEVPVLAFGAIVADGKLATKLKKSSAGDQWKDASFMNTLDATVRISGSDVETREGAMSLMMASDCEMNEEEEGDSETAELCGSDAAGNSLTDRVAARSKARTALVMVGKGSDVTHLEAVADYSVAAQSVSCDAGNDDGDCMTLEGDARVSTMDYCLEVSAYNTCDVLADLPGVSCEVHGNYASVQLGDCK